MLEAMRATTAGAAATGPPLATGGPSCRSPVAALRCMSARPDLTRSGGEGRHRDRPAVHMAMLLRASCDEHAALSLGILPGIVGCHYAQPTQDACSNAPRQSRRVPSGAMLAPGGGGGTAAGESEAPSYPELRADGPRLLFSLRHNACRPSTQVQAGPDTLASAQKASAACCRRLTRRCRGRALGLAARLVHSL